MASSFKGYKFNWAVDDQGRLMVDDVVVPVMYKKGTFSLGSYKLVDELFVNEKGITIDNILIEAGSIKSFSSKRKMAVQFCIIEYQEGNKVAELMVTVKSNEGRDAEKSQDLVKILPEIVAAAKEGRLRGAGAQPERKTEEPGVLQQAAMDPALLEKLKKMVQVSEKLKISQIAQILKLKEADVYDHIVDWAAEFGFTLDEDVVKFGVGRKDEFIASLEKEFADWGKKAENKDGKM